MLSLIGCAACSGDDLVGVVIKDERTDGVHEMRARITAAALTPAPDGTAIWDFAFAYLFGAVDSDGIAPVDWQVLLVDRDRNVLAEFAGEMRAPNPELTEVLVHGDRTRRVTVEAPGVDPTRTYVVWATLWYRDDILFEQLVPVGVTQAWRDPILPEQLPDLLNF